MEGRREDRGPDASCTVAREEREEQEPAVLNSASGSRHEERELGRGAVAGAAHDAQGAVPRGPHDEQGPDFLEAIAGDAREGPELDAPDAAFGNRRDEQADFSTPSPRARKKNKNQTSRTPPLETSMKTQL